MKSRTFFLFCLICFAKQISAQEYQYSPIINTDLQWSYCDVVRVGMDDYEQTYYQLFIEGDTLINETAYKKVYRSQCSLKEYIAAMRETDKKVYAVFKQSEDDNTERLIYDFNLKEGDLVSSYGATENQLVTKIDTVEVAGKLRQRFYIDNSYDVWIEGIGSLDRFFPYPLSPYPLYELGLRLNYQKKESVVIYKTGEFFFSENDCNPVSIIEAESDRAFSIFPNPFDKAICVEYSGEQLRSLTLYDQSGRRVFQKTVEGFNVCVEPNLPPGTYALVIETVSGKQYSKKIIKQ